MRPNPATHKALLLSDQPSFEHGFHKGESFGQEFAAPIAFTIGVLMLYFLVTRKRSR